MTGRERLLNILNGAPTDRLSWTTLATEQTRSCMSDELREMPLLDFYRFIGCDVIQLGSYGLPKEFASPRTRCVRPECSTEKTDNPDGTVTRTYRTPWGNLTSRWKNNRLVEHQVASSDDIAVLTNIWRHTRYEDDGSAEEAYQRIDEALGSDGVCAPLANPSPLQQLIEFDMGLANFYYLLQDCPDEMDELISTMHAARREEYELLARGTSAPAVISMENTSTTLVSPQIYSRYTVAHMQDFCRIMQQHGKKAILHMCGLLNGLLPDIARTGLDGINGLTPPTVGDVPYELALDKLGEDLIVFGGCIDQGVFQSPNATVEKIHRLLDTTYTERIRRAHFVLWAVADGLATPVERFLAIRDWMEENSAI